MFITHKHKTPHIHTLLPVHIHNYKIEMKLNYELLQKVLVVSSRRYTYSKSQSQNLISYYLHRFPFSCSHPQSILNLLQCPVLCLRQREEQEDSAK